MLQAGEAGAAGGGQRFIGSEAIGYDANGRPVLLGCRCNGCANEMVPAVEVCPVCGAEDMVQTVQPGEGTLYSYTVVHVGHARWRKPLAIGYVDLANGVRVFTHLEGEGFSIGETMTFDLATIGKDPDGVELTGYVFKRKGDAA